MDSLLLALPAVVAYVAATLLEGRTPARHGAALALATVAVLAHAGFHAHEVRAAGGPEAVAVAGHMTPLIAAILMPLSSVSVVGFVSLAVWLAARSGTKAAMPRTGPALELQGRINV